MNFKYSDSVFLYTDSTLVSGHIIGISSYGSNNINNSIKTVYHVQTYDGKRKYNVVRIGDDLEVINHNGYYEKAYMWSDFRFKTYGILVLVLIIALFAGV